MASVVCNVAFRVEFSVSTSGKLWAGLCFQSCRQPFPVSSTTRCCSVGPPALDPEISNHESERGEEFRVYEIPGLKKEENVRKFARRRRPVAPPRYLKMPTDQDWTNVWPAASTFKYSVVPLPLRQGYAENSAENGGISPAKHVNAELMKIPNFFHLTPSHIKKHCAAIKHLCTEWPTGLNTDEDCQKHFPIEVTTCDYLFSSPSIRDPRARNVTLRMKLSTLDLDDHARDKFIRLVGDRYDKHTDLLTMKSDRCPTKKQNYDYIQYLLTALYFESQKQEDWDKEITEPDMASFTWEMTPSKTTVLNTLRAMQQNCDSSANKSDDNTTAVDDIKNQPDAQQYQMNDDDILDRPDVQTYREAVTFMVDEGENSETISKYKQSVLNMLNINRKNR